MSHPTKPQHQPSLIATYSDLFERMLDPTFLIDPTEGIILEANPAAERVFSVGEGDFEHSPEARLLGKTLLHFVDAQARPDFERALRVAMRRHHPRLFEMNMTATAGPIIAEVLACPLRLSNGSELLQVIIRDISFRRQAEKKMQSLIADLETANQKLERLSTIDGMTGLHNYRYFSEELQHEHMRAARYQTAYSIIFFDVDHFKNYNDRNGHPAGDELLRRLAKIIKDLVRSADLPARYGGEEFVVLCPHVSPEDAMNLAERIRTHIAATPLPHSEGQPSGRLTVSVGVAGFPDHGQTAEAVIEAADDAMYFSKKNGRNRTTLQSLSSESKSLQTESLKKAV